ncbi:hypothetical protein N431DRAFT_428807 [Stipitochalara longipes BDJ]|nr:hypothetical protein N431DRAFT_428807 [Stipitochalara longipes BDJ]
MEMDKGKACGGEQEALLLPCLTERPAPLGLRCYACEIDPAHRRSECSARLIGSSYGLPAFDIFNSIATVIFDYIVIGAGTLAFQ